MEKQSCIQILRSLALGVDPSTGEVLTESCLKDRHIVKALIKAANAIDPEYKRQQHEIRNKEQKKLGVPWTKEEDYQLLTEFDSNMPIPMIAIEHQRSAGAIKSRLIRFGKLQNPWAENRQFSHGNFG